MLALQNFIHYLEEGGGGRWVRYLAAILAFAALAALHNRPGHYEPFHPEAMDAAQVAHHLAEGKGFSTDYLRPLSFYLLEHKSGQTNVAAATPAPDLALETREMSPKRPRDLKAVSMAVETSAWRFWSACAKA